MFQSGKTVGIYTLIKCIGRGGFGEVWLSERRTELLTTKVAVKLPLDEQVDLDTVKQEALLWEQASGHSNVLPIIEANIYDGQVVIVSEYAPDGSLSDILKQNKIISIDKTIKLIDGILSGLEHLHSRNVIHRDLKPANILLQGKTPRLADFGISRALKTTQTSQSVNITGTPPYMAPEAFDGKRNMQTDMWSVGVILYCLLTGNLPFPQQDITSLIGAIVNRNPEPLPDTVPQWLKNIVTRALAKNPQSRFISALEMRTALQTKTFNQEEIPTPFSEIFEDDDYDETSFSDEFDNDFTTIISTPNPKKNNQKKLNSLAPVAIALFIVLMLSTGFILIYSFYSFPDQEVSSVSNKSEDKNTPTHSITPVFTPTLSPSPISTPKTPQPTQTPNISSLETNSNVANVFQNDSIENIPPPQQDESRMSKNQIQQGFATARQLLINDMFQVATALSRKRHSASRIETCVPNVSMVNQTSQKEQYVGVYKCYMRGKILGVNAFEVTTRITGEIFVQGNNFNRQIINSQIISDFKINNRQSNSDISNN